MVSFIAIWAFLFVENGNKDKGSQLAFSHHLNFDDFTKSDQTITVQLVPTSYEFLRELGSDPYYILNSSSQHHAIQKAIFFYSKIFNSIKQPKKRIFMVTRLSFEK